jgi:hypothetical protein
MTASEIQALINKLFIALANDELEIEDADGNRLKYKSNADIERAIARFEKLLRRKQGHGMAFTLHGGKGL